MSARRWRRRRWRISSRGLFLAPVTLYSGVGDEVGEFCTGVCGERVVVRRVRWPFAHWWIQDLLRVLWRLGGRISLGDGGHPQRVQIWVLEELGVRPRSMFNCRWPSFLLRLHSTPVCKGASPVHGVERFLLRWRWPAARRFLGAREGSRDFCVISRLFRVLSEVRLNQLSLYPLHPVCFPYLRNIEAYYQKKSASLKQCVHFKIRCR